MKYETYCNAISDGGEEESVYADSEFGDFGGEQVDLPTYL